jgi:hypothetical protein
MTIEPDTKDWTWVLRRSCPECGLDTQLATAAEVIAAHFDDIAPGQWQRTGRRSDGADFTIESFGRYFIHDPIHHLYDVTGTR